MARGMLLLAVLALLILKAIGFYGGQTKDGQLAIPTVKDWVLSPAVAQPVHALVLVEKVIFALGKLETETGNKFLFNLAPDYSKKYGQRLNHKTKSNQYVEDRKQQSWFYFN